jgi:hypothetical protein
MRAGRIASSSGLTVTIRAAASGARCGRGRATSGPGRPGMVAVPLGVANPGHTGGSHGLEGSDHGAVSGTGSTPASAMTATVRIAVTAGAAGGLEYVYDRRTTALVGRADDCDPQLPPDRLGVYLLAFGVLGEHDRLPLPLEDEDDPLA